MDDLILHCGWNIGSQLSYALKELCISDRYMDSYFKIYTDILY